MLEKLRCEADIFFYVNLQVYHQNSFLIHTFQCPIGDNMIICGTLKKE